MSSQSTRSSSSQHGGVVAVNRSVGGTDVSVGIEPGSGQVVVGVHGELEQERPGRAAVAFPERVQGVEVTPERGELLGEPVAVEPARTARAEDRAVERLRMREVVAAGQASCAEFGQGQRGEVGLDAGELVGVADAAGVPQDARAGRRRGRRAGWASSQTPWWPRGQRAVSRPSREKAVPARRRRRRSAAAPR